MESAVDFHFVIRLLINTASVFVLIRCYYAFSRHRENAASFILFGVGVFLVTALLHSVTVTMGFAFGLFAVFSMLRYRTEALGIKEMTYLFLVIAMALLAAVGTMHHLELVCLNLLVIVLALVLETRVLLPRHSEREVEYEKIDSALNISDICTKPLAAVLISRHRDKLLIRKDIFIGSATTSGIRGMSGWDLDVTSCEFGM